MHELSIVQSIFSTLESELEEKDISKLSEVQLKIGKLANVEPILLQNAFSAFQESNEVYKDVTLSINQVCIKVYCSICDEDSEVENYSFKCAKCERPSNQVVQGEELLIEKVKFS